MSELSEPNISRESIAEALTRLVARVGLDAVSLRSVAAEAGCSLGRVQRLFVNKDALLSFAVARIIEQASQSITRNLEDNLKSDSVREMLELLLQNLISASLEGRDREIVWLAFLGRAAVVPALAAEMRRDHLEGMQAFTFLLRKAQEAGEIPSNLNVEMQALALLALVEGLNTHILFENCDSQTAQAIISTQLNGLFLHRFSSIEPQEPLLSPS